MDSTTNAKLNELRREIKFYNEALSEEANPEGVNRIRYIINSLKKEKEELEYASKT